MESPIINWFVKESENDYVGYTEYFAGSCISNEDFIIDLEVWNNRWNNSEDAENIIDGKLEISFLEAEDSVLLQLCKVKIDSGVYEEIDTSEFNRGVIRIGDIYGTRNTGTYKNTENYKRISIKFENVPGNFKDGLKSLLLNIRQ